MEMNSFPEETGWSKTGFFVGKESYTSEEALKAANLDWSVQKTDIFYKNKDNLLIRDDKFKAIIRESDNKRLSIQKASYTTIQNSDAFKFMDSLAKTGEIKYHSVGSFRDGRRVWMLAKINESDILPNDRLDNFLFLHNSHDGTSSLKVLLTPIRIVCTNAINGILMSGENLGINIRHTINANQSLDQAREILAKANERAEMAVDVSKYMTKIKISDDKFKKITKQLIPDAHPDSKERAKLNVEKARSSLVTLFKQGQGQDIEGVAGTGWAAINAVTEYIGYQKPARGETAMEKRLESSLLGTNKNLVREAKELIMAA